jgi:hypothetical protein
MGQYSSCLCALRKPVIQLQRSSVQFLIQFGIPMIFRLVRMCLYETCSQAQIGTHLSDTVPI